MVPAITQLLELREEDWKDDAASSKLLRKRFREEKKVIEQDEKETKDLQKRSSLAIPLVPEVEEDVDKAKRVKFTAATPKETLMRKVARHQMTSIFNDPKQQQKTSLLTKERLEQDRRTAELAEKKKRLGIDHRKFHLMEGGGGKDGLLPAASSGFPLQGLVKVKRPASEDSVSSSPSTTISDHPQTPSTLLGAGYDTDDEEDNRDDAEEDGDGSASGSVRVNGKVGSLVDY